MNFHNIQNFLAIVEEDSISKAADRLHISQQALSEQLKKLEDEVGTQLIRRGRQITLTPAGMIFKQSAIELLTIYQDMIDSIATVSLQDKRQIILAIPNTETPPFLPGLLSDFSLSHPEYNVIITKCQPRDAIKESIKFDLYFSTFPLDDRLVHEPVLENDNFAVAFAKGLPMRIYGTRWPEIEAQLLEQKDLAVLKDMPFILLDNQDSAVVLDQELIFQEAGFTPKISFQSENSDLNANMCILGSGAYVATMDSCLRRFHGNSGNASEIMVYPIKTPFDPINIVLSHRPGAHLNSACHAFIEETRTYLKNRPK